MFNSKQRYKSSHGAGGSNSRWHLPPSQFPPGHQSEIYNLRQPGQYGVYGHQQSYPRPAFIAPQSMQGGSNGGNFNMQAPSTAYGPPGHDYYGPPRHDYYGPSGHDYYGPPEPEISVKELRLQNLERDRTTEYMMYELLSNECKDEAERDQQRTRLLVETVMEATKLLVETTLEATKLESAADQKGTSRMFDYANNNRKHPRYIDVDGDDSTAYRMSKRLSNECKDEAERDQQRTRLVVETVMEATKLERAATLKRTSIMSDYANNNRKHPRDIDVDGDDSTEGVGRSTKKHRTSGNETEMQDENAIQEYTQFVIKQHEEQQEEMARLKVQCDNQDDELKKIRGYRIDDLKDHEAELKDIQEQHGVDMEKAESHNKKIVQSKNEIIQTKNGTIQSKEELATLQRQIIEKFKEEIKSLRKALQEKK
ncbi:hypothetical protein FRACYDRAFT_246783 [Fragilariopsis cylindrus CCMP1102]|uniref:Uncharacterized protein n=1 Tax=Fragilariopsis cylindrus CCMP1102 TaxID=635003 RepID=A0A1E7EXZ9_9STRA|nr:hypothetical protein FRACYDRAFT_246783 [Fragilariopsis cylindrus CCMP1102]|eukprot:OEU10908.1 hypothetical protein FRACYDRAFT_246783 [Fragilariopsis cylindrus CCMP1102]